MKDYSAMSDFEINKLVAEALGNSNVTLPMDALSGSVVSYSVYGSRGLNLEGRLEVKSTIITRDFCNNPADAWPIIAANHIGIMPFKSEGTTAWPTSVGLLSDAQVKDENPLRAAMIVYLQMMEQKS